jgi:hypothetical protein
LSGSDVVVAMHGIGGYFRDLVIGKCGHSHVAP